MVIHRSNGETPLSCAAKAGKDDIVNYLLSLHETFIPTSQEVTTSKIECHFHCNVLCTSIAITIDSSCNKWVHQVCQNSAQERSRCC